MALVLCLVLACERPGAALDPESPAAAGAAAEPTSPEPGSASLAERFSAERAWQHLEALVAMGPRAPGRPGHARARQYLREQLGALGARVEEMPFTHQGAADSEPQPFTNVSGLLGSREGGWILLGTHFDTRVLADNETDPERRAQPIPGANDGASGVAVLLEMARLVSEAPPDFGVEFVFFDAEDYGHASLDDYIRGSRHLVSNWQALGRTSWPEAVVIVDMVCDADLRILAERSSDRALTRRIWRAAARLGEKAFASRFGQSIVDDHLPFVERGVPAALVIDLEYPAHHTLDDDLSQCALASLRSVGRVVTAALFDDKDPPIAGSARRTAR